MNEREALTSALIGCACVAAVVVAVVLLAGCDARVTDDPREAEPVVGPAGPRGPRGIPGPACVPDALETYQVTVDDTTIGATQPTTARAFCEDGDLVLSGGCAWSAGVLVSTLPTPPLERAPNVQGWECRAFGDGAETRVTAVATCLVVQ